MYCSVCHTVMKFEDLDLENSFLLYRKNYYTQPILICKSCCKNENNYKQFLEFNKNRKRTPLPAMTEYWLKAPIEWYLKNNIIDYQRKLYYQRENRKENIKIANSKGKHTKKDIDLLKENQQGLCYWCKNVITGKQHVDHIIPITYGGDNSVSNLCISCHTCNVNKHNFFPKEFVVKFNLTPLDNRWQEQEKLYYEKSRIALQEDKVYISLKSIGGDQIEIIISIKYDTDKYQQCLKQKMTIGDTIKFLEYDFTNYKLLKIIDWTAHFKYRKTLKFNEYILLKIPK